MNYLLRDIPPALWRRVRAASERDGRTLRSTILRLLEVYAPKVTTTATKKRGR
jgi:hypothetical protein